MRSLVVYESMYGNTRQIAEAIAAGLGEAGQASAIHVAEVNPAALAELGLLVLGGPTHAWGMTRPGTRKAAVAQADKAHLTVEGKADAPGIRELLAGLPRLECPGAAFDTRLDAPVMFTGQASRSIAHHLRKHGVQVLDHRSFLVTRANKLRDDSELAKARAWGVELTARRAKLVGTHHD